jgi:hypothetical protein
MHASLGASAPQTHKCCGTFPRKKSTCLAPTHALSSIPSSSIQQPRVPRQAPPWSPQLRSLGSRRSLACRAMESYIVDKLKASEMTFKEMQLRMADPEVRECTSRLELNLRSLQHEKGLCNVEMLLLHLLAAIQRACVCVRAYVYSLCACVCVCICVRVCIVCVHACVCVSTCVRARTYRVVCVFECGPHPKKTC